MKRLSKIKKSLPDSPSMEMIKNCILALGSLNGIQRTKARLTLVAIGEPAVDILAQLAIHPLVIVRWEAIKALSQIKNAITAPVLINALEDDYESIRWIAGEGLIALGKQGLISLLEALMYYKPTVLLRKSARHVVKELSKRYNLTGIEELIESMKNNSSLSEIPHNSKMVLNALLKNNHTLSDSFRH